MQMKAGKNAKKKADDRMDDDAGPIKLKGKQKVRSNGKFGARNAMRRTRSA